MKIKIISVGKLKEKYLLDAQKEYTKRLSKYTNIEIIEVKDEHCPQNYTPAQIEEVKKIESQRILNILNDNDYIITLNVDASQLTSEDFSKYINDLPLYGNPNIAFIIGGSNGHHNSLLSKSNKIISLSKMTFPHQLTRIILLEQIYRSFKINNNEPYHK